MRQRSINPILVHSLKTSFLSGMLAFLVFATGQTVTARETGRHHYVESTIQGDRAGLGTTGGVVSGRQAFFSDTLWFGSVDSEGFAIAGETWTWDHGGPDPLEGWTARTTQGAYGADSICWDAGLGYGNDWCQRLTSPTFTYAGSGTIDLSFTYFLEAEENFDYTRLLLRRADGSEWTLNSWGFTGLDGTNLPLPPTGAPFLTQIGAGDLGGSPEFSLVFEFESDGGWSDEDGSFATS